MSGDIGKRLLGIINKTCREIDAKRYMDASVYPTISKEFSIDVKIGYYCLCP